MERYLLVVVAEGQGGFRSGRFCIDQTFVLKQLAGKYRKKRKELYADRVVRQVNEKAVRDGTRPLRLLCSPL